MSIPSPLSPLSSHPLPVLQCVDFWTRGCKSCYTGYIVCFLVEGWHVWCSSRNCPDVISLPSTVRKGMPNLPNKQAFPRVSIRDASTRATLKYSRYDPSCPVQGQEAVLDLVDTCHDSLERVWEVESTDNADGYAYAQPRMVHLLKIIGEAFLRYLESQFDGVNVWSGSFQVTLSLSLHCLSQDPLAMPLTP